MQQPYHEIQNHDKRVQALLYIGGWYFFSLSISIYNKWMFGSGLDFKFPILITSFHQFCLMVLSGAVLYYNPHLRPTSKTNFCSIFSLDLMVYLKQIIPCSLASSGDIGFSNVSFRYISLSLYTMLKTSSLVFVLLFGILFKLEKFNWRLIVIVFVMTISVTMMVAKPVKSADDSPNETKGILFVLTASMMSGLRWSFTQILLKRNKNPYTTNSINTIFYLSPTMCVTLFFLGLIFEGGSEFIHAEIWQERGIFTTLCLMIVPGFLAFMMTLCEFKLLSVVQVITLSIAGIFKELLTIALSSIIFGDKLSWLNMLGLFITLGDILWYNVYRFYQNKHEHSPMVGELDFEDTELEQVELGSLAAHETK